MNKKSFACLGVFLMMSACSSVQSKSELWQPCYGANSNWPRHPEHYYDDEIHLVPKYTNAPKGSAVPNYMSGYQLVFVKPGSAYSQLGLQSGDTLTGLDDIDLNAIQDPQIFQKLKAGQFKTLRIDRCLQLEKGTE